MTQKDYERLAGLIPDIGSTPKEAKGLFSDLRSQIAAKFGGKAEKTTIDPKEPRMNPLIDLLLGGAINIAQDVGTGIRGAQTQPTLQKNELMAKQLEDQAYSAKDPQTKKLLLQQANQTRQSISQEAGDISKSFSPDVQQNPLLRSLFGASQIAGTAEIPALSRILAGAPKKLVTKLFSQGKGNVVRNEAIQLAETAGQKIQGGTLKSAVDEWAIRAIKANPAAEKSINKFVAGATKQFEGKTLSPNQTFQLWEDARKGFTAAGTKGASLEASYHRAIRDVVRTQLDKVAPGFEAGTKLIKEGLNKTDFAKKLAWMIGGSAATGISTAALFNLLGFNKKE